MTGLHRSRLEQVRRSLAMAPSLPGDVGAELLAEVHRLLDIIERSCDDLDEACADLDRAKARLRGRGPVTPKAPGELRSRSRPGAEVVDSRPERDDP